jgi:hypothetical protein
MRVIFVVSVDSKFQREFEGGFLFVLLKDLDACSWVG